MLLISTPVSVEGWANTAFLSDAQRPGRISAQLPDIRSTRDARRLQHRHCGLLCLAATGVLVMAACRLLLQ